MTGKSALAAITLASCLVLQGSTISNIQNGKSDLQWSTELARAAEDFQESVGVNTHLSYTDTSYYTRFASVLAKLKSSGIHHVRDGYYYREAENTGASAAIFQNHKRLAANDITVLYSVGTKNNGGASRSLMDSYLKAVGDAEGLEAGNECDLNKCIADALEMYPTLEGVSRDLNIYLLAPSMTGLSGAKEIGQAPSAVNFTNIHVYYGGRPPYYGWGDSLGNKNGDTYASTRWWLDVVRTYNSPSKATMVTETGYPSVRSESSNPPNYTLIDSVAASYIPRTLLNNFNAGVVRTFIYEFVDEGKMGAEQTYGLLRSDLSEKPAFLALKNMLSVMADSSGRKAEPRSLMFAIRGADRNTFHTLLQKKDGTFLLIVWQECASWDPASMTRKDVVQVPVTIALGESHHFINSYKLESTGQMTIEPLTGATVSTKLTDQVSVFALK